MTKAGILKSRNPDISALKLIPAQLVGEQRRVNDTEVLVLAKTLAVEMTELYPSRPKGIGKVLRQGRE